MDPLAEAIASIVWNCFVENNVNQSDINTGHPRVSNSAIARGDIASGESRQRLLAGAMMVSI